jgi:DNA-binding MarR family transcriptional regulator
MVEYGIVAVLGRRKPITIAGLAELLGMDKEQLSRAPSNLVRRKLVERSANPQDSREVLMALTSRTRRARDDGSRELRAKCLFARQLVAR